MWHIHKPMWCLQMTISFGTLQYGAPTGVFLCADSRMRATCNRHRKTKAVAPALRNKNKLR